MLATKLNRLKICIILVGLMLVVLGSTYECFYYISSKIFPVQYRSIVFQIATENKVDPLWFASIIYVESSFNPKAVSVSGAHGWMQLLPSTAIDVAGRQGLLEKKIDLFDPSMNLKLGIYYYQWLFDQFKDHHLTLMAYNAGQSKVSKWIKNNPDLTTQQILKKITYQETRYYVWRIQLIARFLKFCHTIHLISFSDLS